MGDEIEKRITQMKMVMEENKSKNYLKLEELRYKHTMEALKFMAEHNITSFNLSLSDRQLSRLSKSLSTQAPRKSQLKKRRRKPMKRFKW